MAKQDSQKREKSQTRTRGTHIIVLPIEEDMYEEFISDKKAGRQTIETYLKQHPELFPSNIDKGFRLNGRTVASAKTGYQLRIIEIDNSYCRILPCFLFPYMRALDEATGQAIRFIRYGVPFWVIAEEYGHDPMYWYRLMLHLGKNSIVGTTAKSSEELPEHITIDEEHVDVNGEKHYIATTVAEECFFGMDVSSTADETGLTQAYRVFKQEAQNVLPGYQPLTCLIDGWKAAINAVKHLFGNTLILLCFLHAFLKVRTYARKKDELLFKEAATKVWDVYRAPDTTNCLLLLAELKAWTKKLPASKMKDKLLSLCSKKKEWLKLYCYKDCYRTSNMLDRQMRLMDRFIFMMQDFHGTAQSATKLMRGFALVVNFSPLCSKARDRGGGAYSRFQRLNGFVYHDNWLKNLNIAASLNGFRS